MSEITRLALVGVVVFVTHCLEGVTGFGCTVLALPFVAMLLGLEQAVPVLVVLAWLLAGYIVLRNRRHIDWLAFRFILLHAAIGLPVGLLLFAHLPERELKLLLALFMIGVGVRGVWTVYRHPPPAPDAPPAQAEAPSTPAAPRGGDLRGRAALLLGGVIHGAFGTGGPFVVIHAARALPEKTLFRVTLCLLWLTLNTLMMLKWTWSGDVWTPRIGTTLALTLPFLIGGMLLGDWLHHRVKEKVFRLLVYLVLAASGAVMLQATLTDAVA